MHGTNATRSLVLCGLLSLLLPAGAPCAAHAPLQDAPTGAKERAAEPPRDGAQEDRERREAPPGERGRRGPQRGAPDWPRAGGIGPATDRPFVEGLVAGDLSRREISDEDMKSAIEVARLVSPEWGETLASRLSGDPESFRSALRGNARRLLALVVLRERAPKVFEAKVAELQAQAATQKAAEALRAAAEPDRAARETELDAAARAQVEATLKAREAELAALEERVAELRRALAGDGGNREALAAELRKRVMEEPRPRSQPPAR